MKNAAPVTPAEPVVREPLNLSFNDAVELAEKHCNTIFRGDARMMQIASTLMSLRGSNSIKTILGEPGVGKEGIARWIHMISLNHAGLFLPVNSARLIGDLAQSEVYGHTKGAFTGADHNYEGACGMAKGGTVFFDEVENLSEPAQAILLRLFSGERAARQVGGREEYVVDANFLCASNSGLERMRGDFRSRISACTIVIPPVSDRSEAHKKLLVESMVKKRSNGHPLGIQPAASDLLLKKINGYEGNGRWLDDRIGSAAEFARSMKKPAIEVEDVERSIAMFEEGLSFIERDPSSDREILVDLNTLDKSKTLYAGVIDEAEKQLIVNVLRKFNGNMVATSEALGIARQTLSERMKRFGINVSKRVYQG